MANYSTFDGQSKAIDRLYFESLHPFVSHSELCDRMKQICEAHDAIWHKEDIFKVNPKEDSKTHNILAVNERIRMVEMLYPTNIEDWERAYHIPPMCEYLLLTGFDILGQKGGWMPFSNWMESKKERPKLEKQKVLGLILANLSKEEYALAAYKGYQEIYGVTNSFFSFFKDVLTIEQKERLLNTILIKIHNDYSNDLLDYYYGDETEKIRFLFKVRNDFTHNCDPTTHHNLLWPNSLDSNGWFEKATFFAKKKNYSVRVRPDFFNELKWALRTGLWEYVKKHSEYSTN